MANPTFNSKSISWNDSSGVVLVIPAAAMISAHLYIRPVQDFSTTPPTVISDQYVVRIKLKDGSYQEIELGRDVYGVASAFSNDATGAGNCFSSIINIMDV